MINGSFRGTCCLHLQGRRISEAKKNEALLAYLLHADFLLGLFFFCCSGTSVCFQRATLRYMPEDRNLLNCRSENLESYVNKVI
jgi:hypothetical protein